MRFPRGDSFLRSAAGAETARRQRAGWSSTLQRGSRDAGRNLRRRRRVRLLFRAATGRGTPAARRNGAWPRQHGPGEIGERVEAGGVRFNTHYSVSMWEKGSDLGHHVFRFSLDAARDPTIEWLAADR